MPEQQLSIYLSYLSHGRVFCKDFFFFFGLDNKWKRQK